jgi:hypothetical protein
MKTTLLMKNLTFNLKKLHKLKSSLEHSFRLDKVNISERFNPLKTKDNFISYEDNNIKNMGDNENQRLLFIEKVIEELEKEKPTDKITLTKSESQKRSKSFKVLSEKISDISFKELLKSVQEKPTEENIIEIENRFKELNIYQKPLIKNFNAYIELLKKGGSSSQKEVMNKIVVNEMLLKIPNHNQISDRDISHKELLEYGNDFMSRNFPMYKKICSISHYDEEVPELLTKENMGKPKGHTNQHIHIFNHTKNIHTNEYDFYQQQYLFVKKNISKLKISEEDFIRNCGTGTEKQNYTQLKNQGILFQEIFYMDINENLFKDKGIEAYIKDKKEITEIDIDYNLHTNGKKGKYNNLTLIEETNEKNKQFNIEREQELRELEKENLRTLLEIEETPIKGKTKEIFELVKQQLLKSKNGIGYISDKQIISIVDSNYKKVNKIILNIQDKRKPIKVKIEELEKQIEENLKTNTDKDIKIISLTNQLEEYKKTEKEIIKEYDKLILDFNKNVEENLILEVREKVEPKLKEVNSRLNKEISNKENELETLNKEIEEKKEKLKSENLSEISVEQTKLNKMRYENEIMSKEITEKKKSSEYYKLKSKLEEITDDMKMVKKYNGEDIVENSYNQAKLEKRNNKNSKGIRR